MNGASFGRSTTIVASTLTIAKPASRTAGAHSREQLHRIGILPARVGIGKARAEIPERRGAEQRIGERVREHVAVGVAERTALERDANAAEDERAPLDEPMRVEAVTDAHHPTLASSAARSRRISSRARDVGR